MLLFGNPLFAQDECSTPETPDSIMDIKSWVINPSILDSNLYHLNKAIDEAAGDEGATLRNNLDVVCETRSQFTIPV